MITVTRLSQTTTIKIVIIETPGSNWISCCGGRGRHDREGRTWRPLLGGVAGHASITLTCGSTRMQATVSIFWAFSEAFVTLSAGPRPRAGRAGAPSLVVVLERERFGLSGPPPLRYDPPRSVAWLPRSARLFERMRSGAGYIATCPCSAERSASEGLGDPLPRTAWKSC